MRTAIPRPYLAYYPAIWEQCNIEERINFIQPSGEVTQRFSAGHPVRYEALEHRQSYDTLAPVKFKGVSFRVRLGDIALARSGDKGSNLNFGIFVQTEKQWDWLRSYLSRQKVVELLGKDWKTWFHIERVEMPMIYAVHFVVYGILGRGVSSSTRLDGFGKGFADYLRDKIVEVPEEVLSP